MKVFFEVKFLADLHMNAKERHFAINKLHCITDFSFGNII